MEKGGISRWIFIVLAAFLAWQFLPKLWGGGSSAEKQPIGVGKTETAELALGPGEPAKCALEGGQFKAELSARGAALVDYWVTGDRRYADEKGAPLELMSVPGGAPSRFTLHDDWRSMGTTGPDAQMTKDVVDWKLASSSPKACTFEYEDDRVALTKTFTVGEGPYEIDVSSTIENLSDAPKTHRLGIENTAWRLHEETQGHLGRVSPLQTDVACSVGGKIDRKSLGDFEPKHFKEPEFHDGWYVAGDHVDFVATSNAYFTQALVPREGPAPQCALQVEERWSEAQYADKTKAPDYGAMYRSRLLYPSVELKSHEKATYTQIAYIGPKDRDLLATAAGGQHNLSGLIDLGHFAVISKLLVGLLVRIHGFLGNWGLSIIALTVCVRLLLFPLTWKQIQNMVGMRRLKPEIDEINRRFADDAQQKQMAMMELYRKNGVNPFTGCLPMLVQMPVWWALYTTLQTAVEFYHTPFLWFRDLSAPDPFFILPVIIGATSFVQQKIMPQQAMDQAQAKMMLYAMPAVFTVMMLFLPSGLGVYILTNSVLGIVQQQAVERFAPTRPSSGEITVKEKTTPDDDGSSPKGKGSARKLESLPAKLKG